MGIKMRKIHFKNLLNDSREDLIASDLIPQDLEFNSKDDLVLKIQNIYTGDFVLSRFLYSKKDNELISESVLNLNQLDYEISATLINIKTNYLYPITVYFDSTLRWGTLRMKTESNMNIWGCSIEENNSLYTKISILLN